MRRRLLLHLMRALCLVLTQHKDNSWLRAHEGTNQAAASSPTSRAPTAGTSPRSSASWLQAVMKKSTRRRPTDPEAKVAQPATPGASDGAETSRQRTGRAHEAQVYKGPKACLFMTRPSSQLSNFF